MAPKKRLHVSENEQNDMEERTAFRNYDHNQFENRIHVERRINILLFGRIGHCYYKAIAFHFDPLLAYIVSPFDFYEIFSWINPI